MNTRLSVPIDDILDIVHNANKEVLAVYTDASEIVINYKEDDSPITKADILSHSILINGLSLIDKNIPVVSEEQNVAINIKNMQSGTYWLIDPIDGTKDFIKKNDQFTICVALMNDGSPEFGVVSAPALGDVYYGGINWGSFVMSNQHTAQNINCASSNQVVLIGNSQSNQQTNDYIDSHYPGFTVQPIGSQLKFAYIAQGRAYAYPRIASTMRIWDVAAGHAIVEGAGGRVTRPNGSLIDYSRIEDNLYIGDFVASAFDIS